MFHRFPRIIVIKLMSETTASKVNGVPMEKMEFALCLTPMRFFGFSRVREKNIIGSILVCARWRIP